MGLLAPRMPVETSWPGGPVYAPRLDDNEDDPFGPPSRMRSDAPASTRVFDTPPTANISQGIDMDALDQPPTRSAPNISQGVDMDALDAPSLPATASTQTPFDAPELAGYRQKQKELGAYQQSHATYDPNTGDWTPKKISRPRAIGLAALRGLAGGPGGALAGALVGLISPGRVARAEYERGLGRIRMESRDELERARAEAGIRAQESNISQEQRPDLGPVLSIYGEGEDQPRLATRNKTTGAVDWLPAPGGGPAYGAVKPQKADHAGLLDNAIETTDAEGNALYRDKISGKIIMDPDDPTGKTPLYKARVKMSDDETTARANAERSAKSKAATAEAKQHSDMASALREQEKAARLAEAKLWANPDRKNPEDWQKQIATVHAEAERLRASAVESDKKRIEAETRAQENSTPLPAAGPPKYGGGRAPAMPRGAQTPQQADYILKRAASEGKTVYDAQGNPIANPYATRQ